MAFRKKAHLILRHQPDILVVQECEHPDKLAFAENTPLPTDQLWFGSNVHKGLGIFSYGNFRFRVLRNYNPALKMIIPVAVTDGSVDFTLYAIWANHPDDPDGQYVEQVWKAIHHYNRTIRRTRTLLIGDFNSNSIWDRKYRAGNHTNVVMQLAKKGIASCYHLHFQQLQGGEKHPTLYLYRHLDKPYHIDYCFASKDLTDQLLSVEVGAHAFWTKYSDHVPVIISFEQFES